MERKLFVLWLIYIFVSLPTVTPIPLCQGTQTSFHDFSWPIYQDLNNIYYIYIYTHVRVCICVCVCVCVCVCAREYVSRDCWYRKKNLVNLLIRNIRFFFFLTISSTPPPDSCLIKESDFFILTPSLVCFFSSSSILSIVGQIHFFFWNPFAFFVFNWVSSFPFCSSISSTWNRHFFFPWSSVNKRFTASVHFYT